MAQLPSSRHLSILRHPSPRFRRSRPLSLTFTLATPAIPGTPTPPLLSLPRRCAAHGYLHAVASRRLASRRVCAACTWWYSCRVEWMCPGRDSKLWSGSVFYNVKPKCRDSSATGLRLHAVARRVSDEARRARRSRPPRAAGGAPGCAREEGEGDERLIRTAITKQRTPR